MYFTIKKGQGGYRARLYGANNRLIWWTEGYRNKTGAENAIRLAMQTTTRTPVYDRT